MNKQMQFELKLTIKIYILGNSLHEIEQKLVLDVFKTPTTMQQPVCKPKRVRLSVCMKIEVLE